MNIQIRPTEALLLHGTAAELHYHIDQYLTGMSSAQDLTLATWMLRFTHPTLMATDPYCLHLQGFISDMFGDAQEAIAAYTEAAIQLSLIEDPIREAAAYTALARIHHLTNNLPAAIHATQNATLLHLHEGNTTSYHLHTLTTYTLTTALHDPEFLTTPYAQTILTTIHKSTHNTHHLYTHTATTPAEPTN